MFSDNKEKKKGPYSPFYLYLFKCGSFQHLPRSLEALLGTFWHSEYHATAAANQIILQSRDVMLVKWRAAAEASDWLQRPHVVADKGKSPLPSGSSVSLFRSENREKYLIQFTN